MVHNGQLQWYCSFLNFFRSYTFLRNKRWTDRSILLNHIVVYCAGWYSSPVATATATAQYETIHHWLENSRGWDIKAKAEGVYWD